jgi:acyl carrier protein
MNTVAESRFTTIRGIVSEVLEIDPSELTETSRFIEDHNADSLRAIEILSRLEKRFEIEIPETALKEMSSLGGVYAVMTRCAGWTD